ncbi:hypothetical protein DWQ65_05320 [Treponema phagedenis]|nr:hypothetical protein DWQ65_05320 [Treponema phagedenis]
MRVLKAFIIKSVRHGARANPSNCYLWFAYEFCLFAIRCQAKHRLEFCNGGQFTIGMLKSAAPYC